MFAFRALWNIFAVQYEFQAFKITCYFPQFVCNSSELEKPLFLSGVKHKFQGEWQWIVEKWWTRARSFGTLHSSKQVCKNNATFLYRTQIVGIFMLKIAYFSYAIRTNKKCFFEFAFESVAIWKSFLATPLQQKRKWIVFGLIFFLFIQIRYFNTFNFQNGDLKYETCCGNMRSPWVVMFVYAIESQIEIFSNKMPSENEIPNTNKLTNARKNIWISRHSMLLNWFEINVGRQVPHHISIA